MKNNRSMIQESGTPWTPKRKQMKISCVGFEKKLYSSKKMEKKSMAKFVSDGLLRNDTCWDQNRKGEDGNPHQKNKIIQEEGSDQRTRCSLEEAPKNKTLSSSEKQRDGKEVKKSKGYLQIEKRMNLLQAKLLTLAKTPKFPTQTKKEKQKNLANDFSSEKIKNHQKKQSLASETRISTILHIEQKAIPLNHRYYIHRVRAQYKSSQSAVRKHVESGINFLYTFAKNRLSVLKQYEPISLNWNKIEGKKLLVLDLDQTLVRSSSNLDLPYDFVIKTSSFINKEYGVKIRPYTKQFLKNMAQYYEIVVFTASNSEYANEVLDYLDKDTKHISYRLYRENCSKISGGIYLKDLAIFNRNEKQIVVVDNSHQCFCKQLDNGVPIFPYFGQNTDHELEELEEYLLELNNYKDIRVVNREQFKLHKYAKYLDKYDSLVQDLYGSCN